MLEADGDLFLLGQWHDLFPAIQAVLLGHVGRDAVLLHAGEGDDPLVAGVGAKLDRRRQFCDALGVVGGIYGTLLEPVTADQGNVHAQLFHQGIVVSRNALHCDQADFLAELGQLGCRHRVEGPTHDGLLDPAFLDAEFGIGLLLRHLGIRGGWSGYPSNG